ncbi:hypothetical protein TNCV_3277051 [Trichonephila clavipes]|nr:hypothetical protein TNCV_3277051 [Trichonephila clavipes]
MASHRSLKVVIDFRSQSKRSLDLPGSPRSASGGIEEPAHCSPTPVRLPVKLCRGLFRQSQSILTGVCPEVYFPLALPEKFSCSNDLHQSQEENISGLTFRMKIAPLKKSSRLNQLAHKEGRPNLRWIDCLEKDLLVLRIKNWRTLAREGWPGKDFLLSQGPPWAVETLRKERTIFIHSSQMTSPFKSL